MSYRLTNDKHRRSDEILQAVQPRVMLLETKIAMFNYKSSKFEYLPFPRGVIDNVIAEQTYSLLVKEFPPINLFLFKPSLGNKYSLSSMNNPDAYFKFIRENKAWNTFYNYATSEKFIDEIFDLLKNNNIDLSAFNQKKQNLSFQQKIIFQINHLLGYVSEKFLKSRIRMGKRPIRARFEFQIHPADGGYITPHTDSPRKLITIVLTMHSGAEWDISWGGGTEVQVPIDEKNNFNHINYSLPFDKLNTIQVYDFNSNQALIFLKTFNSWHCVKPINGPQGAFRRSIVINLEDLN